MSPPCLEEDDVQVLRQASKLQSATKQALYRIQSQVSDTAMLGCATLEELHLQREHLDRIMVEGDRLEVAVDTTEKLQNRFARGSLRFGNASAARRLVNKETKFRTSMEERGRERAAEITQQINSPDIEVSLPVITKHSQPRERSIRKNKESTTEILTTGSARKSLLFGVSVAPVSGLEQLEQNDDEIEETLEGLGSHIDELVRMSNEMAYTVQSQDKSLQHVNQQLERVTTKQQVANHRSRWFLSGKKRETYERKEFFDRHSLIRKAIF